MNTKSISKKMKAEKEMVLVHNGTVLSCCITANEKNTALYVFFGTEIIEGKSPDQVISVRSRSRIDLFCPSVEGTVIWCKLESGKERFYDTRTGERITTEKLKARSEVEKIHFYE